MVPIINRETLFTFAKEIQYHLVSNLVFCLKTYKISMPTNIMYLLNALILFIKLIIYHSKLSHYCPMNTCPLGNNYCDPCETFFHLQRIHINEYPIIFLLKTIDKYANNIMYLLNALIVQPAHNIPLQASPLLVPNKRLCHWECFFTLQAPPEHLGFHL